MQLKRLDNYQDLSVSLETRLTYNQRKTLKTYLKKYDADVFATTSSFDLLRAEIFSKFCYCTEEYSDLTLLYLKNIAAVVELRCANLYSKGRLQLNRPSNNKILLVILGDKGNKFFKLGLAIGNIDRANNPSNMLLLGMYKGNIISLTSF